THLGAGGAPVEALERSPRVAFGNEQPIAGTVDPHTAGLGNELQRAAQVGNRARPGGQVREGRLRLCQPSLDPRAQLADGSRGRERRTPAESGTSRPSWRWASMRSPASAAP